MSWETTIKYAAELDIFLAMLLRPQGSYCITYTPALNTALQHLRGALQLPTVALEPMIDKVLDQIWTVEWHRSPICQHPDPTEHYIILSTLRRDGTFSQPKQVTPLLAKLKYLIRVYMVRRMTDDGKRKETVTTLERWFWEKQHSSFNTVCDLQHKASSIAMFTQELANVWWIE